MFDKPIFVSGRSIVLPSSAANLQLGNADLTIPNTKQDEYYEHMKNQLRFAGVNLFANYDWANREFKPFSNLTLRGQSVVKYKKTKRSEFFDPNV